MRFISFFAYWLCLLLYTLIMRALVAARSLCSAAARRAVPALARSASSAASAAAAGAAPDGSAGAANAGRTTHFGYQTVDEGDKQKLVGDVFHRVAESYDVMNDLMSAGMHRLWKDEFVRMAGNVISTGDRETVVLDVAGGTGDIAFRIHDAMRRSFVRPAHPPRIIVSDINPSMLGVGRERSQALGYEDAPSRDAAAPRMEWRVGDAEALTWVPDNSVDLYTIAFGIRNVTHVDAALREAHRVLRPGGRFMCLEFSRVTVPLLAGAYDAYSFAVIPAMGAAVAGDRASYQYLVESIRRFPDQEAFADMISDAGFAGVTYRNLTFGVCAVHTGYKLPAAQAAGAR